MTVTSSAYQNEIWNLTLWRKYNEKNIDEDFHVSWSDDIDLKAY